MCEPKICENTSPSSVARHALVEEEEQDLPLSLSEGELFMEPGLRDIECRIRAVEQRCNFKVASQRRITAMLQLLVEDHARLMDMLPASQCASKKLRCSSLPVQPRAGTNSSAKSLRAEEGNRLLMDSQPPPPRPPRRSTTTFPMKVLPEGEPEVMGCKTSGSRGEALSVKEVLARQAAQAAQLSSHAFGDHLPLLLRAPDSPCGLCCFKLWRGLLALCGAAALWDSPRTERAQRCRHFLHVAATLVLAMFAIAIGLLRFVSLVPQEVEPLRDFTRDETRSNQF
ncbi:unnamed protein product [Symbiodinium natans]|uniref:Uncharacterized protein n=1 Tax=Symbiodinium natans TaxID=878477 RepID=A0A812ULJ9_9DINO|nr:unnamed protein product [Symbiodinium natans]